MKNPNRIESKRRAAKQTGKVCPECDGTGKVFLFDDPAWPMPCLKCIQSKAKEKHEKS